MSKENLGEELPNDKIQYRSETSLENFPIEDLPLTESSSAEPSRASQLLAFGSILLGGLCGGLIGFAFTDLQCSGSCSGLSGLGGLMGAIVGAGGVGIVSVLVLRAMNEWKAKNPESK